MGAVTAILLTTLLVLHWVLVPGFADDGCSGFKHLENGRTFFRYGGLFVTFSCNPGFRIHGYRTSSCVSGQWAREPPLCVAPGCPSPGEILHGNMEVSPDSSLVHFTCESGFRLFGSSLLYCKGKRWNGTMPLCKESDIMSSFYQKQMSFYKPIVELDLNSLSSLKSRFNTIAHTASKEEFLKPFPQPKPFPLGDMLKVPQKPSEKGPVKKPLSDKATTQGKGGTVGLTEMTTRLDFINKPDRLLDSIAQPLPAATLLDTTQFLTNNLTPAPLLSSLTGSTILANFTPAMQLDDMLSPAPTSGEIEGEHHLTSATHSDNNDPVTPFPGKDDLTDVVEAVNSQSTQSKVNTQSSGKHSLVEITSLSSPNTKDSTISSIDCTKNPLPPFPQRDDTTSPLNVAVTVNKNSVLSSASFPDPPVSKNKHISLTTTLKPFMVNFSPFDPAVIRDGELSPHESLTTRADEDLLPWTEVPTAATRLALALHLTESPDVPTKDLYLQHVQHPLQTSTHRKQTNGDEYSASIDAHGIMVLQINGELNDLSRSLKMQALQNPLTLKNKMSVTSSNGPENKHATRNHSVTVEETLDLAAKHNSTQFNVTPEIPGFLSRKRRPICPYPPLPAHGTFYFRTIANPAPFQYKHYVQYACYPGYTLANGDVYSYCLQDRQWSGVTPMCIEETPCSSNNGGCSQVCQVNDQNQAECHCKAGFVLLEDQLTCRDLNECVEGLHQCQQVCENTFGSYRCSCSAGFQLSADRMSCTDVDECVLPAGRTRCVFGCVNTPGSFYCHCPAGYSLNITEGHCNDVDECMENGGRGPCESSCVNSPGSFHCLCPHGYQVAGDGRACVSECSAGYRKLRSASATGTSTTEPCTDINECEEMEQRQIQQQRCEWKCVNLPGTYRCVCPRGYLQHPDGHHCTDINECTLKNGGCSHTCLNLRGGFKCVCPENYRISPYNRRKCQPLQSSPRTVS